MKKKIVPLCVRGFRHLGIASLHVSRIIGLVYNAPSKSTRICEVFILWMTIQPQVCILVAIIS